MHINKSFLLLFLLFLSATIFYSTSCAQSTQLNWIGHWKGEDKRESLVDEVKKEFEFLNPDIRVNLVHDRDIVAKGDNFKWKTAYTIVEMIRTGNIKWDVVFLDIIVYNYVAELLKDPLWGVEHLVDFSTVPGFLQTQKEFIINDAFYRNQTGGLLVGPYIEGYFFFFCQNKELARKAGVKIRERNMSVEDLLTYARQLSEYNKKNNSSIPLIWLSAWNRLESLFFNIFRSYFDDPEVAIEESYSKEKEKAFFDTLLAFEKLSQYQPVINKDWQRVNWDEFKTGFLEGKGLLITGGSFMYNHFMAAEPEKFKSVGPAEYPVVKKSQGLVGNYTPVFAVMKNSPNKKVAIDLLMLWSEPKVAEKWVNYTRNPTGIKGHLDEPAFKAMPDEVFSRFVTELTEQYRRLPMRYYQQPVYVFGKNAPITPTAFREDLALILQGKQTASNYFNDVMKRFNQEKKPDFSPYASEGE
ncbi:MAG: ABC transporter substrate-binding protein [Desulfopila sp.]|jgi:ABC-type glycerol-3-phosphate transport system substrate-binding protein|nr:ABC transporter substrate-binding protein [Desulfopila sp.]